MKPASGKVIVVDDDPQTLKTLERVLHQCGYDVTTVADPREMLALLTDSAIDVVLTDILMPGMDGIELCSRIRELRADVEVLVMTGVGSIEVAVRAMKSGAYDFLMKPFENLEVVRAAVAKAVEHKKLLGRARYLEKQVDLSSRFENIVGVSPKMAGVFRLIESVAPTDCAVLVTGESGTGKELVARAIHERSLRRSKPFLPVHCSALTETLLESELFGHVKGAFTGAAASRKGLFEEADGGTLFLDEVGETPPATQVKILRALQEGEVKPVGSSQVRKVDVRIISATNLDLQAGIKDGRFRQDLFYRINVIAIVVPPLRERPEDVPPLVRHFLRQGSSKGVRKIESVDRDAMSALMRYPWPGNVRELEHMIERASILTPSDVIGIGSLPEEIAGPQAGGSSAPAPVLYGRPYNETKEEAIAAFERTYLHGTLASAKGNIAEAARLAGMDRSNFRRLLTRYGIDAGNHREE